MADYQKVEINERSEEENITLEQQAQMQAEAAEQQPEGERPQWLDEKFESPEDLAKAYQELQAKQSKGESEETEEEEEEGEEVEEERSESNDTIAAASLEWHETGELSEDTYESLQNAGISREMVDSYIAGQTAMADNETNAVKNEVGGADSYAAMLEWAGDNLEPDEIEAYNSMVESGNLSQAKVAAKGLYAQYVSAGGKPPKLSQGNTSGSAIKPFSSTAQITQAMSDPRYKSDPAFRQSVQDRIEISNVI